MRIKSITMHNFRMYKDIRILFKEKSNKDMQLIIGKNGMGKTTFLNAINWCLYNEEPHAYKKESSLPILNLSVNDSSSGSQNVFVKIEVVSKDNERIIFKREEDYKNGKSIGFNIFSAEVKKKSGETETFYAEEAEYKVCNFVPYAIREFFFFDGEQLDSYFLNPKAQKMKNNIFILSHIDILNKMEKHLEIKITDFRREAGRLNPHIEVVERNLEKCEKSLKTLKLELTEIKKSVDQGKIDIDKLERELNGVPEVDVINKRITKNKDKQKKLNEQIEDKKKQIMELNFNSAPIILLYSAIEYTLKRLKEEEENLPPAIDEEEVRKSLESGSCTQCHQGLTDDTMEYMQKILNDYKFSTEESKKLLKMEHILENHKDSIINFNKKRKDLIKDQNNLESAEEDISEQIENDEKQILGFNEESISKKYNLLKKLKEAYETDIEQLGAWNKDIEIKEKEKKSLDKELMASLEDETQTKDLNKKVDLCSKAIDCITKTKDQIVTDTKDQIEDFTKKTFFDLIWKKETFSDITIDDYYNLELIHSKFGQNCLGSASAAERELLALAFTLGVHSISGFDSPLLIDTPLARVSDDHRINFSNVLLKISEKKQIILILTPDEFSDNIKPLFDDCPQYKIETSDNEYISNIKEVN